ncbi:MAG: DNA primase [Pelagibacteraceae bacterium]|nr:DNA primase [Pelagibacteraceae bacterium]
MPNDNIREIIDRVSIVEVISKHISLTKKGSNFFGLSPFKNEKTPSFSVNEEKKMFKCFSTGEGGNVFDFLIKVKGYTFKEALFELSERSGVEIQTYKGNQDYKKIYEINEFCKEYFHNELLKNQSHLDYFKEKRNFNEESINTFKLGSIVDTKSFMVNLKKKFSEEDLLKSFILKKKDNRVYSFFSNRVIIPIISTSNKVLAFGARTIGNDTPKYINSAETKVFKKKNVFYNEVSLTNNLNKKIIITEGYFDVIKMHQVGIKNVLAPLGTSVNHEKIIDLTKRGLECIICFDGDTAGRNSMLRLLDNLMKSPNFELGVKFVLLPKNEDPDQLIDSNKTNFLKDILSSPLSIEKFIEKYLEQYSKNTNVETQYKGKKFLKQFIDNIANQDLKKIFSDYFKNFNIPISNNSKNPNQLLFNKDLKSKFSAAIILAYIENVNLRGEILDLILSSKFNDIFEQIRLIITNKSFLKKLPNEIYEELDLKGLNFTKNELFSREIRRLCRFANNSFKGDFYLEVERAIEYINKNNR